MTTTRPQLPREDLISWQDHAECRRGATALFSGVEQDASGFELSQLRGETSRLCGPCPVVHVCLETAMWVERAGRPRTGVWGGLAPDQRAALARNRISMQEAS